MKKRLLSRTREALRRPKWRHGGYGALALIGLIAVCVLLNLAVQSLEDTYGWRKDFSFNAYATTGEETEAALSRLTDEVELYLLYQNGELYSQLYEVLERYGRLSDLVRVLPTDIAKNPGVLTRFQGDTDTTLAADSVVVSCAATGRYRILSDSDFVTLGYNVEAGTYEYSGLVYEKRLTEAIVYVTEKEIPVVGVLQGHGELGTDTLQTLLEFLQSNNYASRTVTLLAGDTLDGVDMLLIADPQKDFAEGELETIKAFAEAGGSLLVMRDYTDPLTLPNYLSLLRSYGVVPLSGVVIAGEDDAGGYYSERVYLVPTLCDLELTRPLIEGAMDVLLMPGACAFETPGETDGSLSAVAALKSGPNAYRRDPSDGNDSIDRQPGDPTGEMTLAVLSARMHVDGNVSRMFAIGNSAIFTADYMYQSTFSEEFLLRVMGELLPQKTVSLDIMAKSAFHPALTVGSQTTGLLLVVGLPLLVLLLAVCVLVPRRNR